MSGISTLTYPTHWPANGLSWSCRADKPFRFAVGSFLHEYNNTIELVQRKGESLVCRGQLSHSYPPTKLMFAPPSHTGKDLLISTADYLRIWEVSDRPEGSGLAEKDLQENQESSNFESLPREKQTINSAITMAKVYDFGKPNDFCSPVTSCDWNVDNPAIVGCCSIDTTVTIWDIQQEKHTVQLIAHDKDVFDIAFAQGSNTFASCGADGAVRIFDLREMEHCTIVYESPNSSPLLRVAWSMINPTYICTFGVNDKDVVIIDTRFPTKDIGKLAGGHQSSVNSSTWAPHSNHISTAGEDGAVNIWNLDSFENEQITQDLSSKRILTYDAFGPVNSVSWSASEPEFVGITTGCCAQVLHI